MLIKLIRVQKFTNHDCKKQLEMNHKNRFSIDLTLKENLIKIQS